jgi:hypothetical protein
MIAIASAQDAWLGERPTKSVSARMARNVIATWTVGRDGLIADIVAWLSPHRGLRHDRIRVVIAT